MTRTWFALHVAAAVGALSLIMLAVSVGVGESQPAGPAQTTTAPSQLTEQFPLGDRKLAEDGSSEKPGGGGGSDAPDDGGSMLWLLFLVPVAVLVLMVWLVAYARSGPPTAYGYALGNEPRRRRQVPSSVIRLLSPLFAYNHHRDAYILRGIGNRRGPVLKMKHEGEEPWAVRPAKAPPAAAPIGVRGEARPASGVRERAPAAETKPRAPQPRRTPASARPNGGAPSNGSPAERRRRPRTEVTTEAAPSARPNGAPPNGARVDRRRPRAGATAAASPPAKAEGDTAARAPATAKPKSTKSKSAKAKAAKRTKATTAGKNGKTQKTQASPKTTKPKTPKPESTPSLTDALNGQRPSPTGRFKRDEAAEDRPATNTRK